LCFVAETAAFRPGRLLAQERRDFNPGAGAPAPPVFRCMPHNKTDSVTS
jgi:hypothetical protein